MNQNQIIRNNDELRKLINRELSNVRERELTNREFDVLLQDPHEGPVAKYRLGTIGLAGLVAHIRQYRAAFGGDRNHEGKFAPMLSKTKRGRAGQTRAEALSRFLAAHARRKENVTQFRTTFLSGRCIKLDNVQHWINSHLETPRAVILTMMAPDQPELAKPSGKELLLTIRGAKDLNVQYAYLEFGVPRAYGVQYVGVSLGGVLDQLRNVSRNLSENLLWEPAQATVFVLTDLIPRVDPLTSMYQKSRATPAQDRIHMTIDPELSPREVIRAYRGTLARSSLSSIRLSERRLRLAAFMATRPPDEMCSSSMQAWNKGNADMKYTQRTNFARDAKIAVERTREFTFDDYCESLWKRASSPATRIGSAARRTRRS